MKKFFYFLLMLLISVPCIALAQDKTTENPKVEKIVTVGYSLKDQSKIFGDKSIEEIDKILDSKCRELLENDFDSTLSRNSYNDYDGLIVTVNYPQSNDDNNISEDVLALPKERINLLANGERRIADSFRYRVGFNVGDMGTAYGGYQSDLTGAYSDRYGQGYIHSLNTYLIEGANFPTRDVVDRDHQSAHCDFFQPYDIGHLRYGIAEFRLESGGRFVFLGVN